MLFGQRQRKKRASPLRVILIAHGILLGRLNKEKMRFRVSHLKAFSQYSPRRGLILFFRLYRMLSCKDAEADLPDDKTDIHLTAAMIQSKIQQLFWAFGFQGYVLEAREFYPVFDLLFPAPHMLLHCFRLTFQSHKEVNYLSRKQKVLL